MPIKKLTADYVSSLEFEFYRIDTQYGIFVGDDPFNVEHVAYTVKQYDKMHRAKRHKDRIALVVSRKRSLPMLTLAGLNPTYISSDIEAGERDCLNLFPVGYGDDYIEEESVKEEEIEAEPEPTEAVVVENPEGVVEEQNMGEEDEIEEHEAEMDVGDLPPI